MILAGGPHPTTSYQEVLKDKNIDLCVIGEGEATLEVIIKKFIKNKKNRLSFDIVSNIDGIAFSKDNFEKITVPRDYKKVSSLSAVN